MLREADPATLVGRGAEGEGLNRFAAAARTTDGGAGRGNCDDYRDETRSRYITPAADAGGVVDSGNEA